MMLELHHNDALYATSQEASMKAITLRNLPPELTRIIRQKADEQHASINKVVISLLEKSVGVRRKKGEVTLHHDLDALAGTWTREEAAAFNRAPHRRRDHPPDDRQRAARLI